MLEDGFPPPSLKTQLGSRLHGQNFWASYFTTFLPHLMFPYMVYLPLFTYMFFIYMVNVGIYTIHGSYGVGWVGGILLKSAHDSGWLGRARMPQMF